MNTLLSNLIEALRHELQQYGEILALLDQQHEVVKCQGPADVLRSVTAIEAQSVAVQAAREGRLAWQRRVAEALHQAPDAPYEQMQPLLPEAYRPLVAALVQENNELVRRVREHAQQNQSLLERSLAILQRCMITLASEPQPENSSRENSGDLPAPLYSSS